MQLNNMNDDQNRIITSSGLLQICKYEANQLTKQRIGQLYTMHFIFEVNNDSVMNFCFAIYPPDIKE